LLASTQGAGIGNALSAALLWRIRDRIIGDFLMPSRLDQYRALLEAGLSAGYRFCSVADAWEWLRTGEPDAGQRQIILRHDIDTDPGTAAVMWQVDRSFGVNSSYFFRLSTFNPDLIAEIAAQGGEASYHYEELATIAKRHAVRSRSDLLGHLPEARDRFAQNLTTLRRRTGLPMRVVASHGDFVNIRLSAPNWLILADDPLREQLGIELETYDQDFLRRLPCRITDRAYPTFWNPRTPASAIRAGEPIISLLVHPRHWRVDPAGNARDDARRIEEGVRFALGVRS
jgi:hypothetical protein